MAKTSGSTLMPASASLANAVRSYWQADRGRLAHASKTALAVVLSMWLSMRLELSSPRTAMVSAVILMMHQHSGMVLARGFYRALGMLVGNLAALLLFFAFPQERVLFLLCLSVWTGLCVCGAAYYRNYQSYGFVLAGYATCIAAVPSINNPYAIFDNVIVSLSEVSIGILCAGLVSALIFPQRVATMMLAAGQQHITTFIGFIREALRGRQAPSALGLSHLHLMGERAQLENLRSAVVFEDPELRANNDLMIRLNHDFLDAIARFHSIHQLRSRIEKAEDHSAGSALDLLFDSLSRILPSPSDGAKLSLAEVRSLHASLLALKSELPERIASASAALSNAPPPASDRFAAGAAALYEATADLLSYTEHYIALRTTRTFVAEPPRKRPRKLLYSGNRAFALASGLRAAIAILACSWLWIASGWNGGSSAVIAAAIAIALYSVMPQPTAVARQMLIGCAAAWLAGLFFNFFILPRLDGFLLLAVCIVPFIMAGSYLGTFPKTATIGLGFGIYFSFLSNLTNPTVYNPTSYLDAGLATLLGIAIASLAFATIVPQGGHWLAERYLQQLRKLVAKEACHGALDGLRLTFESNIRDFVQYAGTRPVAGRASQVELLGWSFAALEIGLGVINIREAAARDVMPARWEKQQDRMLAAISALFLAPSPQTHEFALRAVERAIEQTAETAGNTEGADPGTPGSRRPSQIRAILHFVRLSLQDDALPLVNVLRGTGAKVA
ncbi:FUSC family protein [Cupriavidus sp. YAF13]|uniref:FUSC family protein n=1 Tax=Cupriavidus sp. YAF13 TaxID=3233075 RepID=UPI003F92C68D